MTVRRLLAGVALLAASCLMRGESVSGGDTGRNWLLSQWHRRVWQIEDGLPHNYVTATLLDSNRYLLIGTQTGMARFDGTRFTPLSKVGDLWVYSLLRTSDGSLWIGTYLNGLRQMKGDHVTTWGPSQGLNATTIYSMLDDHSGGIWLATTSGLEHLSHGCVQLIIRGENTNGYGWQTLTEDDSSSLWFATSTGLFRYHAGQSETIHTTNVKGLPVTTYYWKEKRQLYLGTTSGFYRLNCVAATCVGRLLPEIKGPVVSARAISDGSLWLGTWGEGLYRLTGERIETLSSRGDLADDFVRTISEDNERNVWIGTRGGGLTRFRATALKPVGIPEGLNGNCASVATGDGGDGVWLGTWRSGLYHWQNGVIHNQALPESPLGVLVSALATNKRKDLWIGTFHNLWLLQGNQTRAKEVHLQSPDLPISHILVAQDGSLWIAKEGLGLFVFHSGDPRTSTPERLLSSESVTALQQDRSGTTWIGTERGVWTYRGTSGPRPVSLAGSTRGVTAVSEDSRGRIWIAAKGRKVYVYDAGRTTSLKLANLPAAEIFSVEDDRQGSIWFGTGRGLARGRVDDVNDVLASRSSSVSLTPYGVAEGMRTVECRCAKQPQSWSMPNGTLWVPTAKGFIQIDSASRDNLRPPQPLIEEALLDGRAINAQSSIQLSPGDHELEARFTAIRLGPAEGVRFRYRLEGFEDQWIEAGSQRVAHYSHLSPGKFRLLVSARDAGDAWSSPAGIDIEQRPHLYEEFWFRVTAMLVFAGSIVLLFHVRLRVVRSGYRSVLEERNRIAREWHDTLLAGLSAVAWQVDAAVQVCSESRVTEKLQEARGMLRYCRDEARRAIGDLRDEPGVEPRLPEAIRHALAKITAGTEVEAELNVSEKLPRLPAGYGADLVRICQEATSNAMRHGRASRVTVLLDCSAGQLSLYVKDNGIGFDGQFGISPAPGHFGILGMRERAKKLGGTLQCCSELGKGTVVCAEVPLP